MSRKKIVAANWKMNLDFEQAAHWLSEIGNVADNYSCVVLVFPSFIMIGDLMDLYKGNSIVFGAQNCSEHPAGAYTGEVSAKQLASVGVEFVIAGHSERRTYFNETNQMIRKKLLQIITEGMTPVFCCGETLKVRNENRQFELVKQQLEESLFDFSADEVENMIIAYEPVWAIGTGINATAEQAQEMHAYIRSLLSSKYSKKLAQDTIILYGGSCKPENAELLFSCPDVDGGLVGTASLNVNDFTAIIQSASE